MYGFGHTIAGFIIVFLIGEELTQRPSAVPWEGDMLQGKLRGIAWRVGKCVDASLVQLPHGVHE